MKSHKLDRKRLIFIAIFVVLVVAAVGKLVSLQFEIVSLRQQSADLDKQIAWKQVDNEELQESLDEGVTEEYIAKIARDVLGYASPGERVFIDSSEQ